MKDKKLDLLALASIPLLMTLGNSMLIPVLPIIEKEIDITSFQASLIITLYSFMAILFIPIAGYLSDKFGRKKVIIPSLIITAIGGAISALASWLMDDPYWLIIVGRILQGLGAAGAFPVVIPTVGDMFEDEEDVSHGLGIVETSNTFGKVLSPIIGALLALVVWFLPFIFIPVFSVIAILLVAFLVKAPKEKKEKDKQTLKEFFQMIKKVLKEHARWMITVFLIGCINMFVLFGALFHFSELLENDFGYSGVWKGFILAVPLLCLCIASFLTGKKIGNLKKAMKWTIVIGNAIAAVPLIFLQAEKFWLYLILLSAAGVGIGLSLPALDALITESVEKDVRGTVTSLYSSMRFLGVALGPPIIALLMEKEVGWMYILLAALSGVAIVTSFFGIKPEKESKTRSYKY
ncbi:ACDE family multidrug resistance protein [Gracilibacillus halotolerans]|uniref:ACDE family multidrug resistance protein n=1 Tax=Gracilibacillus halotolerans TaxID=74386 RepID=A0A841RNZ4_9BACI|nr:ACDE family multidrug resistance protein [Gracilibacillus halotolerans]